jgi:membrane-bound metal-dependent hydrolase YbcI (DUF457 family)
MFVGHYGPGFLAKRADQSVPLWVLFLAVQLMDVFWSLFVLVGIEHVRIVPGFTKTNPLDLYDMPWTHSLPGSLGWSVLAAGVYWLATRNRRGSLLVGAAVFSHWILDLVVHKPDLALWDNTAKVGLGLWDYPVLTLIVEGALVFGGLAAYLQVTRTRPGSRAYSVPVLVVVVFALQVGMLVGPPPASDKAMAVTAFVSYFAIAGVVAWLERGREPATSPA